MHQHECAVGLGNAAKNSLAGLWLSRRSGRRVVGGLAAALAVFAGSSVTLGDEPKEMTANPTETARPAAPAKPPEGEQISAPLPAELNLRKYPISKFELRYHQPGEGLPSVDELLRTTVNIGQVNGVYTGPRQGVDTVPLNLGEMDDSVKQFDALGVLEVTRAITLRMRDAGIIAVIVAPTIEEVDDTGNDMRGGRTTFRLEIVVGRVGEIRSLASGDRFSEDRINNPAHDRIKENSPARAGDYLRKDEIESYAFRLNRHPGRRVDIAVAPGSEETGNITLDYLVSENKPWYVLAQLSNTGTANTERWRERFAFVHNQLTNNDDILRLDYVTAGFAEAHSFLGSYELPVFTDKLRLNITGAYNKYTASDVGLANETFKGESWRVSGELAYNIFQHEQFFLDVVGGARYEHVETRNATAGVSGATDYFLPHAGIKFDRNTDISSLFGRVTVEWTNTSVASTKFNEVQNLGRLDPDFNYTLLRWDTGVSFYLEPLLAPDLYNGRYRPVDSNGQPILWEPGMALVHEISLSTKGQYAFDRRLIPNAEDVVGGFFTVRGYPESAAAGDNSVVASAEYRVHIPRLFGISTESGKDIFGNNFRWQPQEAYGFADWDLVGKVFFDVGRVEFNDKRSFERNATLMGTGVGLELSIRRNIYLRADWGFALRELPLANVKSGDHRLHFMVSFLF